MPPSINPFDLPEGRDLKKLLAATREKLASSSKHQQYALDPLTLLRQLQSQPPLYSFPHPLRSTDLEPLPNNFELLQSQLQQDQKQLNSHQSDSASKMPPSSPSVSPKSRPAQLQQRRSSNSSHVMHTYSSPSTLDPSMLSPQQVESLRNQYQQYQAQLSAAATIPPPSSSNSISPKTRPPQLQRRSTNLPYMMPTSSSPTFNPAMLSQQQRKNLRNQYQENQVQISGSAMFPPASPSNSIYGFPQQPQGRRRTSNPSNMIPNPSTPPQGMEPRQFIHQQQQQPQNLFSMSPPNSTYGFLPQHQFQRRPSNSSATVPPSGSPSRAMDQGQVMQQPQQQSPSSMMPPPVSPSNIMDTRFLTHYQNQGRMSNPSSPQSMDPRQSTQSQPQQQDFSSMLPPVSPSNAMDPRFLVQYHSRSSNGPPPQAMDPRGVMQQQMHNQRRPSNPPQMMPTSSSSSQSRDPSLFQQLQHNSRTSNPSDMMLTSGPPPQDIDPRVLMMQYQYQRRASNPSPLVAPSGFDPNTSMRQQQIAQSMNPSPISPSRTDSTLIQQSQNIQHQLSNHYSMTPSSSLAPPGFDCMNNQFDSMTMPPPPNAPSDSGSAQQYGYGQLPSPSLRVTPSSTPLPSKPAFPSQQLQRQRQSSLPPTSAPPSNATTSNFLRLPQHVQNHGQPAASTTRTPLPSSLLPGPNDTLLQQVIKNNMGHNQKLQKMNTDNLKRMSESVEDLGLPRSQKQAKLSESEVNTREGDVPRKTAKSPRVSLSSPISHRKAAKAQQLPRQWQGSSQASDMASRTSMPSTNQAPELPAAGFPAFPSGASMQSPHQALSPVPMNPYGNDTAEDLQFLLDLSQPIPGAYQDFQASDLINMSINKLKYDIAEIRKDEKTPHTYSQHRETEQKLAGKQDLMDSYKAVSAIQARLKAAKNTTPSEPRRDSERSRNVPSLQDIALGKLQRTQHVDDCHFCARECDYGLSDENLWLPHDASMPVCRDCCNSVSNFDDAFDDLMMSSLVDSVVRERENATNKTINETLEDLVLEEAAAVEVIDVDREGDSASRPELHRSLSALSLSNSRFGNPSASENEVRQSCRTSSAFSDSTSPHGGSSSDPKRHGKGPLFCQGCPWRQIDHTLVRICSAHLAQKFKIACHRKHKEFDPISTELISGPDSDAFSSTISNMRCMVCTSRGEEKCKECPLVLCGGCRSYLSGMCKDSLDNLIPNMQLLHCRNDAFLLRADNGGY